MDGSPANTCSDIQGTSDRYVAYTNVPGKNDLDIDTFRAIYTKDFGDTEVAIRYGLQNLSQSSIFDLDMGLNSWDGYWAIDQLSGKSNTFDAQVTHTGDQASWILGAFSMVENIDMKAHYHATLNGDDLYIQPDRELATRALFGQTTIQISDRLFLTLGGRYTAETKSDVDGGNYTCNQSNGCYPNAERWWLRNTWLSTDPAVQGINAYDPAFAVNSTTVNGINCTNDGYGGTNWGANPWVVIQRDIGCIQRTTTNTVSADYSFFDWRVGLDYDITDNGFLYGYVATGHKSGSIQDVYVRGADSLHPEGPGSIFNTSYDEETALTYELGYKQRFWDNRGNIAINYYFTDYDGKQFSGNVPVDVVRGSEFDTDTQTVVEVEQVRTMWATQNFGKQSIQGLEVEFDLIPWNDARVSGWVTTMKTEVVDDFITNWYYGPDALFGRPWDNAVSNDWYNLVNLKGNELPYSPDLALTVRFEQTFNLGSLGSVTPSVNYHWQSEDYLTIFNVDKHVNDAGGYGSGLGADYVDLPGFFARTDIETFTDKRPSWSTVDLFLTYNPPGDANWYAQAYMYNATDEEISWWRGMEAGTPRGAYSAPSQWGIRVEYFW
jgi:iron complex outermembrane receptor protein